MFNNEKCTEGLAIFQSNVYFSSIAAHSNLVSSISAEIWGRIMVCLRVCFCTYHGMDIVDSQEFNSFQ